MTEAEELEYLTLKFKMGVGAPAQPSATPQSELELLDSIAEMNQPPTTRTAEDAEKSRGEREGFSPMAPVKGVVRGAMDMVNLPPNLYNLGTAGVRAVSDFEPDSASLVTDLRPGLLESTQLTTAEKANPLNRMTHTGTQWLAGAPVKAAEVASRSAPALTRAVNALKGGFTAGKEAIVPAVGAAVGSEIGRAANGDEGALYGELLGGTSKMLTGGAAWLASKGKTWATDKIPGVKDARITAKDKALMIEVIKTNASNPAVAIQNLEAALKSNAPGNLADWTKDQGIASLVENRATANTTLAGELRAGSEARESQILESLGSTDAFEVPNRPISELGAERLSQVSDRARQRTTGRLAKADVAEAQGVNARDLKISELGQKVAQEQQGLTQATAQARSPIGPAEASTQLDEAYNKAAAQYKAEVSKPLWDKFEANAAGVDVYDLQTAVNARVAELPNTVNSTLKKAHGYELKLLDELAKPGQAASSVDVQKLSSHIKTKLADIENFSPADIELAKIGKDLEDFLRAAPGLGYREAVAATKEGYDRFAPSRVDKARRANEPELTAGKLGYTGPAGVNTVRKAKEAENPAIKAQTEKNIRADMRDKLDNPAELLKDKQYGEVLPKFPELRSQIEDLVARTQEVEVAATRAKTGGAAAEAELKALQDQLGVQRKAITTRSGLAQTAINKSRLAEFVKAPEKTLRGILTSADKTGSKKSLKSLLQSARRFGGETQLKREMLEEVKNIVAPAKRSGPRLTAATMDKLDTMKDTLIDSGAMTKEEFAFIRRNLDEGAENTLRTGRARTTDARLIARSSGEVNNILASLAALAVSPVIKGGQSLMINGALRRYALASVRRMERSGDVGKLAILDDYIANPAKFARDMEKADPEAFGRLIAGDETALSAVLSVMGNVAPAKRAQRAAGVAELTTEEEE